MTIFAFYVDHTLEISDGPVPLMDLERLRAEGHVVGLCGNWALVVRQVADWPRDAAAEAGWRFLREAEFAAGLR